MAEINAVINSMAYGYEIKVLINGVDIGMKGGQSESKALFGKDDPMRAQAIPAMQSLFSLQPGNNTIHLEYKKTGQPEDQLTFTMNIGEQPEPIISFQPSETNGTFEKTFSL